MAEEAKEGECLMSSKSSSGGISTLGLLGVAFVVLKLMGFINWSWWWVTAPFWGFALLWLLTVIVGLILVTRKW